MLFNSLEFLIFFPVVVAIYFALPHRYRQLMLLAASYYFYMCWKAEYAILIVSSTVVDYFAGRRMAALPDKKSRRPFLYLSLLANLGLLFAFKYFNFVNESLRALFNQFNIFYDVPAFDVLLPVGISFYTFQTLSYTIDIYRGKMQPEPKFLTFALYVSFFPQLVAGPIERAVRLLPQFHREVTFDYERLASGARLMVWGFFKKVVVADRLATYVDAVYNAPGDHAGLTVILATYFFAFQIYCDFSGYSDIAIGTARILGFDLMTNFRRPYLATNISDFWRRWHISLSTWFRDYVYIPLGGNRVSVSRRYGNLFVTFVVSGIWHGANWTFLVWGALHGFYLAFAVFTLGLRKRIVQNIGLGDRPRLMWVWEMFITFHLALIAWVFFRANSLSDVGLLFERAGVDLSTQLSAVAAFDVRALYQQLVVAVGMTSPEFVLSLALVVFVWVRELAQEHDWPKIPGRRGQVLRLAWNDALILFTVLFGAYGQQQFIYFQF